MLAWNYWVAIVLWLIALGFLIWGMWPKIKKRFLKRPSNHKASVQVENPQYYIVEQGKFTVELGVTIKCPYVPMQLASLQLLIARKAHDFIKILPLFKDEITTKAVSYRIWYKMIYEEFYLGKVKKPNGTDSIAIEDLNKQGRAYLSSYDIVGQMCAKIDGIPIMSSEFEINSKKEFSTK